MTAELSYASQRYYRESGRFSLVKFPLATVVALLASVVCGGIYAVCDFYSPLVYLDFALTIGFGVGTGALVGYFIREAEVRNRALRIVISLLACIVAYYAAWIIWIVALSDHNGDRLEMPDILRLADPTVAWRIILQINHVGAWSLGDPARTSKYSPETGTFLWIVWIAEAVTIFAGFIYMAEKIGGGLPYCETCGRWARSGKELFNLRLTDLAALRAQLESRDFAPMLAQSPKGMADQTWLEVWTHSCDQCQEFNTLSVKHVKQTVDRKGRLHRQVRIKISRLLMNTVDLRAIQSILDQQVADRTKSLWVADD